MIENHTNQHTIVVVEDDEKIAYLLNFMLTREGFRVILAPDGEQASTLIDSMDRPSLMLMDVMLPHKDGFQLIAQIRGKPYWSKVPVLMLTAKSQERDIARALEAGAEDYIIKPFRPNELLARVRRSLKAAR